MRKVSVAALTCFLVAAPVARAAEYYVSPAGNNGNPGTRESPWKTIQKAADVMKPGDTVRIAAGVYHETVRTVRDGSPEPGMIIFAALGDGPAVLDGSGVDAETGFTIGHSYVRLSGLEIRDWSGTGIWMSRAAHVVIEDCEVHDMPYGIGAADGSHHFSLDRVQIHHIDLYGFDASPSGGADCHDGTLTDCVAHTGRDREQNVDGFALGHGGQHGFRLLRCEAYELCDGFDVSAGDTTLDKCSAHDCWNAGYKLWQDNIVLRNCLGFESGNANVELDWDGSPGTVSLLNCTFVGSETFNVWVENPGDSLRMFNCIVAGGRNIGLAFEQPGTKNYKGDYNIFHNADMARGVVVAYEDEFSLDGIASGAWTSASHQDGHSLIVKDPTRLFMNLDARDFRLRPGSPAIDSGTSENAPADDIEGKPRPAGAGFDRGAFERTPSDGAAEPAVSLGGMS